MVTIWWCDECWCDDVIKWWCVDVMMWWCDDVMMWWCDDVLMCWCDECTGRVKAVCLEELYSASWRAEPWAYSSTLCDFNNFSNFDQKQNLELIFLFVVNSPIFQFMIKILTHQTDHKFENKNKSPPPLLPHHYLCHHGAPDRLFSLFVVKMKKRLFSLLDSRRMAFLAGSKSIESVKW